MFWTTNTACCLSASHCVVITDNSVFAEDQDRLPNNSCDNEREGARLLHCWLLYCYYYFILYTGEFNRTVGCIILCWRTWFPLMQATHNTTQPTRGVLGHVIMLRAIFFIELGDEWFCRVGCRSEHQQSRIVVCKKKKTNEIFARITTGSYCWWYCSELLLRIPAASASVSPTFLVNLIYYVF